MSWAKCGHAACKLPDAFFLVLVDPVKTSHDADVLRKLLDFWICIRRIEVVALPRAEEWILCAPSAAYTAVTPSPTMRDFGGRTSM